MISESEFKHKLELTKAFVFDWDGVFNDGGKDFELQSRFNEIDSMGTNMLRFAYYLKNKKLPLTAIISGENNKAAFTFVKRERFNNAYYKAYNKIDAAEHFCATHHIALNQMTFVFDDVLDLKVAEKCGLRIFIGRKQSPLLNEYVIKNKLADYITSDSNYAVRECCELMMGCYGVFDEVIKERIAYSEVYKSYLELRKSIVPQIYTGAEGKIVATTI